MFLELIYKRTDQVYQSSYCLILLALLLTLPSKKVRAQANYFENSYGSQKTEVARGVAKSNDGTIFLVGSSTNSPSNSEAAIVKINPNGSLVRIFEYNEGYGEQGISIVQTFDYHFVFVAEEFTTDSGSNVLAYKINTSGQIIWQKKIASIINEAPKSVIQTSDSGLLITGFINDSSGYGNMLVIKLDKNGTLLWQNSVGGLFNDYACMAHQLPSGEFLLCGDTQSHSGNTDVDMYVVKLDSTGNLIWEYHYGDNLPNGSQGVVVTSKNQFLLYGESAGDSVSAFDYMFFLLDSNGTEIWRKKIGTNAQDAAFWSQEMSSGNFIFCGYSNSNHSNDPIDCVVATIDTAGNLLSENFYGGTGIDIGYQLIPDSNNNFLVCGRTNKDSVNKDDFYLLRVNEQGSITSQENIIQNQIILRYNLNSNSYQIKLSDRSSSGSVRIFSLDGRLLLKEDILQKYSLESVNIGSGFFIVEVEVKNEYHRFPITIIKN